VPDPEKCHNPAELRAIVAPGRLRQIVPAARGLAVRAYGWEVNDKLARSAPALLERLQRSPLGGLLPDVLAATLSIGKSSRADPMGLIVAMMSGFAGVFAPSSAHRVEHALMEFARELEALDDGDRADLRDEEFLHLLRDLIVHSGRTPDAEDRARLRQVLLRGIREREPPSRTRLFFELATRVHGAELETLRAFARPASDALATLDTFGTAVLEREGLLAQGAITALGAQFLRWLD
jgi:hypothetical protein